MTRVTDRCVCPPACPSCPDCGSWCPKCDADYKAQLRDFGYVKATVAERREAKANEFCLQAKVGAAVEVLGAFSCMTHKRESDEYTGLHLPVNEVSKSGDDALCGLPDGRDVWLHVTRLRHVVEPHPVPMGTTP